MAVVTSIQQSSVNPESKMANKEITRKSKSPLRAGFASGVCGVSPYNNNASARIEDEDQVSTC